MKKVLLILTVGILVLGTMAMSFADGIFNPAQVYGDLVGITEEEAYNLHIDSDKTFGTLASEAGVYESFSSIMLESKTQYINQLVTDGKITREQADAILANLANCDGTGQGILRDSLGYGMGMGANGEYGMANGQGRGANLNNGLCDGTGVRLQDGTGLTDGTNAGTGYGRGAGMGGRGMRGGNN
ncbi:hypothetical protein [Fusibacter bizertensis]